MKMRDFSWYSLVMLSGCVLLLLGCEIEVYRPDTVQPEIEIPWPPTNSLVAEDTITLQASVVENRLVDRVEFYVNNQHDTLADRFAPPYTYLVNFGVGWIRPGSSHRLSAKVYDTANNEMMSNILRLHYGWRSLLTDEDDDYGKSVDDLSDLKQVFLRSTGDSIAFRVETHQKWERRTDTTSIINTAVNMAIFLDTDHDSATGMSPGGTQGYTGRYLRVRSPGDRYAVDHIGPEYALVFGVEGDSLWQWNPTDTTWQAVSPLRMMTFEDDTNVVEINISRESIGGGSSLHAVVASVIIKGSKHYWDWAPDLGYQAIELEDYRVLRE